jgi:hypothetical protein
MKAIFNNSLLVLCIFLCSCQKGTQEPPKPPEPTYYNVTAISDNGVTISPSGVTRVEAGKSITYTLVPGPNKKYKIFLDGLAVTGFLTGNYSYLIVNVNADKNIQVTSETITFTVTASAGIGGTITPTGPTTVNYGSDLPLTITENTEYTLTSIKVNGVSVAITKPYVLKNITVNSDVKVNFTLTNILIITNGADDKSRAWMWTHWDVYDENHVWEASYLLNQEQLSWKTYYYSSGIGVSWNMLPGNIFTSGNQTYTIVELTDKKFVYDQKGEFTLGRIEYMRMTYERQ